MTRAAGYPIVIRVWLTAGSLDQGGTDQKRGGRGNVSGTRVKSDKGTSVEADFDGSCCPGGNDGFENPGSKGLGRGGGSTTNGVISPGETEFVRTYIVIDKQITGIGSTHIPDNGGSGEGRG